MKKVLILLLLFFIIINIEPIYNTLLIGSDYIGIPNKYQNYNDKYLICKVKNYHYIINPLDTIVSYPLKCGNFFFNIKIYKNLIIVTQIFIFLYNFIVF